MYICITPKCLCPNYRFFSLHVYNLVTTVNIILSLIFFFPWRYNNNWNWCDVFDTHRSLSSPNYNKFYCISLVWVCSWAGDLRSNYRGLYPKAKTRGPFGRPISIRSDQTVQIESLTSPCRVLLFGFAFTVLCRNFWTCFIPNQPRISYLPLPFLLYKEGCWVSSVIYVVFTCVRRSLFFYATSPWHQRHAWELDTHALCLNGWLMMMMMMVVVHWWWVLQSYCIACLQCPRATVSTCPGLVGLNLSNSSLY